MIRASRFSLLASLWSIRSETWSIRCETWNVKRETLNVKREPFFCEAECETSLFYFFILFMLWTIRSETSLFIFEKKVISPSALRRSERIKIKFNYLPWIWIGIFFKKLFLYLFFLSKILDIYIFLLYLLILLQVARRRWRVTRRRVTRLFYINNTSASNIRA
jgi:hypothetical protein